MADDIIITVRFDEMVEIVDTFINKYKLYYVNRNQIINEICQSSITSPHTQPQQVLFSEKNIVSTLKKYKPS